MWHDREFWRRFIGSLLAATEGGRIEWEDTPDEPTFRAIFADGKIFVTRPEAGDMPPEVVAFERGHIRLGEFRPEQPEDAALIEELYRSAGQHYHPFGDDYPSREGRLIEIKPVLRSIEAELTKTKGGKGTVAPMGRR